MLEESSAVAEEDGDDVDLHLVQQSRLQILLDDVRSAPDADVLVAGGFPIKIAPGEAFFSATIASSVSVFPPNTQAWSLSPSSPIPFPTRTFGPAMNPSSDIEISHVTFPITALLSRSFLNL
jgi:hypothetical protein